MTAQKKPAARRKRPLKPSRGLSRAASERLELLQPSLEAAVPLRIHELRKSSFEMRQRMAADAAQVVAEKGDLIMFKEPKEKRSTREARKSAFNALVTGLAIGAFQPGGVTAFGLHFEMRR